MIKNEDRIASKRFPWLLCGVDGSIYSLKTKRILRSKKNDNGYIRLTLYKTSVAAHIVIADAFLGSISNGLEVNHINGIKHDNRPSNLEYVTKSENAKHAARLGLSNNKGVNNPRAVLNPEKIKEIVRLIDGDGYSYAKVSKIYGVTPETISNAYRGNTWKNHHL